MSTIEVTSPFDGRVVGSVPFTTVEQVQQAIDTAHERFLDVDNWIPKYKRVEILENLMKIMSSQVEELTILCASFTGKFLAGEQ